MGSQRIFFFLQVSQAYSCQRCDSYVVSLESTDSGNESLQAPLALPIRMQAGRLRHHVRGRLGFRNQQKLDVFREVPQHIIVERNNSEVVLNNAKCL